ncbi:MAG TPA: hypothetical protein VF391_04280 [Dermatophilaceae bacterium]|jgi:hypothetical protein
MIRSPARSAFLAGLAVTIALTALVTWRALAPGYLLYRDFVAVPDPVLNAAAFGAGGAPRAVPLDVVTAATTWLIPSWLVQKTLLVGPLLLAGSGVSFLLRRRGIAATLVGSALAVWNPYVAERLLLGQAPTLLGYAMIPWLIAAVRSQRSLRARVALVTLAALPAALTPVGGVMALLTVITAVASLMQPTLELGGDLRPLGDPLVHTAASRKRPLTVLRRAGGGFTGGCLAETGLLCLPVLVLWMPWVVAGLRAPSLGATGSGATAFAVVTDSPAGVVGSVLTLGGVWAPGAWLASRATPSALLAELVLVLVAICAWWGLRRDPRLRRTADLALAAYALTVSAVLLAAGPASSWWRSLQVVPGVAMLRDTHRLLGFAALSVALLCGLAASQAIAALARWGRSRSWLPSAAGVVALVSMGLLSAPDLAARLNSELRPVAFPGEWAQVVAAVDAPQPGGSPAQGSVLILPWQPFRQTPWAGSRPFQDPLPLALGPDVVSARDLLVSHGGRDLWVGGEDPPQAAQWRRGQVDNAGLRRLGISWLVEWVDSPGALPTEHTGLTQVLNGAHWRVWRVG